MAPINKEGGPVELVVVGEREPRELLPSGCVEQPALGVRDAVQGLPAGRVDDEAEVGKRKQLPPPLPIMVHVS